MKREGGVMNISFHYCCVKTLCYLADIQETEAEEIAFYSQFVDDFNLIYDQIYNGIYVEGRPPQYFTDRGIAKRVIDNTWYFYPVTTGISMIQTAAPELLNTHMLLTIVPFHFIPKQPWHEIARNDAKGRRCVQVSMEDKTDSLMKTMMTDFLNSGIRDNMKLGMLLHIFADTYAHQMFSGISGDENMSGLNYEDLKKAGTNEVVPPDVLTRICYKMPPIGHAKLSHVPDAFGLEFSADFKIGGKYSRNNMDTFLQCAKEIWKLLKQYNGQPPQSDNYFGNVIAPRIRLAGMQCLSGVSETMDVRTLAPIWADAFRDVLNIEPQYTYQYDEKWERTASGYTYWGNTIYRVSETFYQFNQYGYEIIKQVIGTYRGEELETGFLKGGIESMEYNGIIIRDDLKEADTGISQRSAASVDIIPYGQEILTWDTAAARYGQVLSNKNTSVISERNCNCYVRGKNLSQKATGGTVQLFLMPYGVFCHPNYWYELYGYVSGQFTSKVPMISGQSGSVSEEIGAGKSV